MPEGYGIERSRASLSVDVDRPRARRRRLAHTLCSILWIIVAGGASACSSVGYREDVDAALERIESPRLREHVDALDAIGPRPVSDHAATRASVDYLAAELQGLGYELYEETVELRISGNFMALVRPIGEPDAELQEIPLPPDLPAAGQHAMQATSEALAEEGWEVDSLVMRAATEPTVLRVPNLIAARPGSQDADTYIEISAHYDTVPSSPGAADNSSGVAAALEVARVVADVPTRKGVRFCFFGAEEVGLRGSAAHLEAVEASDKIAALINLDSIGFTVRGKDSQRAPDGVPWFLSFPDEGDFVVVIGKWSSGWLGNVFEDSIDAYVPALEYYSANRIGAYFRDAGRSDHANYWKAGIPAIFISDTGEFRSPHYHRASDTPETVDFEFATAVTRATAAALLHLAEIDDGG